MAIRVFASRYLGPFSHDYISAGCGAVSGQLHLYVGRSDWSGGLALSAAGNGTPLSPYHLVDDLSYLSTVQAGFLGPFVLCEYC